MIGTRLCEALLERGYSVTGADIRPNPWNQKINGLTIPVDLCRLEDLENLPAGNDMVVHLAANARVRDLVLHPELARDNVIMLFNILEFCRKNTISGILFSSSREVYGNSDIAIHEENTMDPKNCESPYAASKIGGEALVHAYQQCYGIDFMITRLSNVYGMYDMSDRVIPFFIRQTHKNQDLIVYGREKSLDFSYIDDTVSGLIRCIRMFPHRKNTTLNIASGRSILLTEVASLIRNSMGGKNTITIRENRTGEVMRSAVSISRAKKEIRYEPKVPIEEGIVRSIAWYSKYFSGVSGF
jgi:nucleoside-diphosphate-sugar epimerase